MLRTIDSSSSDTIEQAEFEQWMRFWHGTQRAGEHQWMTSDGVLVVRKVRDSHLHDEKLHEKLHRVADERDKARREVWGFLLLLLILLLLLLPLSFVQILMCTRSRCCSACRLPG
eukprot:COSAG05_NODE_1605_length_4417_cov_8.763780_4_plen_115_part_00